MIKKLKSEMLKQNNTDRTVDFSDVEIPTLQPTARIHAAMYIAKKFEYLFCQTNTNTTHNMHKYIFFEQKI